jgi:hypothetical protein
MTDAGGVTSSTTSSATCATMTTKTTVSTESSTEKLNLAKKLAIFKMLHYLCNVIFVLFNFRLDWFSRVLVKVVRLFFKSRDGVVGSSQCSYH